MLFGLTDDPQNVFFEAAGFWISRLAAFSSHHLQAQTIGTHLGQLKKRAQLQACKDDREQKSIAKDLSLKP